MNHQSEINDINEEVDPTSNINDQYSYDGWNLYYSEEGYPYYYNSITGESQWAQYFTPNTRDYYDASYYENPNEMENYSNFNENNNFENNENEYFEDSDYSYDDYDEYSQDEEAGSTNTLERRFREYIRTPQGLAALESEKRRLEKYLQRKERENSNEKEQEYVKNLIMTKKFDQDSPKDNESKNQNGFLRFLSSTYSSLSNSTQQSSNDKLSNASEVHAKHKFSKFDEFGRETKHRSKGFHPKSNSNLDANDSKQVNTNRPAYYSPSSSIASSSSEAESVSSEDSDVQEAIAPLFSDISSWMSLSHLKEKLLDVSPFGEKSLQPESSETHDSNERNQISLYVTQLSNSLYERTIRGMEYTGNLAAIWFSELFDRLNPLLIQFMENVIDTKLDLNQTEEESKQSKNDIDKMESLESQELDLASEDRKFQSNSDAKIETPIAINQIYEHHALSKNPPPKYNLIKTNTNEVAPITPSYISKDLPNAQPPAQLPNNETKVAGIELKDIAINGEALELSKPNRIFKEPYSLSSTSSDEDTKEVRNMDNVIVSGDGSRVIANDSKIPDSHSIIVQGKELPIEKNQSSNEVETDYVDQQEENLTDDSYSKIIKENDAEVHSSSSSIPIIDKATEAYPPNLNQAELSCSETPPNSVKIQETGQLSVSNSKSDVSEIKENIALVKPENEISPEKEISQSENESSVQDDS